MLLASRSRMIKKSVIGRLCYVQKKEGSVHPGIVPGGEAASHPRHAPLPQYTSSDREACGGRERDPDENHIELCAVL